MNSLSPVTTHASTVSSSPYLRFSELTSGQRALLGPSPKAAYEQMTRKQRGVFLILSNRLLSFGLDLDGMTIDLDSVKPNRLFINASSDAVQRLRAGMEARALEGHFGVEKPFGPFHAGRSDWGVRESRRKFAMQIGIGPNGVFIDIDRFNPQYGWFTYLLHILEVFIPGKPSPTKMAHELGVDIWSRHPRKFVSDVASPHGLPSPQFPSWTHLAVRESRPQFV